MVVVDCVFCIFWLSAFASQASFNTADLCGQACGASKAIVGLGLFVWYVQPKPPPLSPGCLVRSHRLTRLSPASIFFGVTSFLSIYTLKFYQFNGRLPGYDKIQARRAQNIDPDMAAFSMAPHDEEAYGPVSSNDRDDDHHLAHEHGGGDHHDGGFGDGGGGGVEDPYGPTPPTGGRQENPFDDRHDLDYRPQAGAAGHGPSPFDDRHEADYRATSSSGRPYAPPRADDDYDDERPVQFPVGNYDRGV